MNRERLYEDYCEVLSYFELDDIPRDVNEINSTVQELMDVSQDIWTEDDQKKLEGKVRELKQIRNDLPGGKQNE